LDFRFWILETKESNRTARLLTTLLVPSVCLLAAAAVIFLGWREANRLTVRHIRLDLPNLPPAFDGYTIVFASDFHVRRMGRFEEKALDTIKSTSGDLLILGGDFQDNRNKPPGPATDLIDALGQMAPNFSDGIVAVRGNHDTLTVRNYLKRHRAIRYLSGRVVVLERGGEKMAIVGARKWPKKERERMNRAVRRLVALTPPDVGLRILVAHWPDYFPAARDNGFDLVLAGDTHGGQIRLPVIGAIVRKTRMPRRYAYGLVRERRSILYTTSGVGTRGLRLRLFCPAEIVRFELRRG